MLNELKSNPNHSSLLIVMENYPIVYQPTEITTERLNSRTCQWVVALQVGESPQFQFNFCITISFELISNLTWQVQTNKLPWLLTWWQSVFRRDLHCNKSSCRPWPEYSCYFFGDKDFFGDSWLVSSIMGHWPTLAVMAELGRPPVSWIRHLLRKG